MATSVELAVERVTRFVRETGGRRRRSVGAGLPAGRRSAPAHIGATGCRGHGLLLERLRATAQARRSARVAGRHRPAVLGAQSLEAFAAALAVGCGRRGPSGRRWYRLARTDGDRSTFGRA
jgi:hypothetical protein